jgi:hypothetical protein
MVQFLDSYGFFKHCKIGIKWIRNWRHYKIHALAFGGDLLHLASANHRIFIMVQLGQKLADLATARNLSGGFRF